MRAGGRFGEWSPAAPAYVVADIDGTLIARGRTATPAVAAAVLAAHAAGLRVGFATGRLPVGTRDLHGQLAPEGPHIVQNGAQVRLGGRALKTWPYDREQARAVIDICTEHAFYAELFVGEDYYVTDRRAAARPIWELVSSAPPAGLASELDLATTEVIKSTVVAFEPAELRAILAALEPLGLAAEAAPSPVFPGASFVNANRPDVDKGTALAFAAGHLGIALDAVVAVGDGLNDISMLARAGTAVAMGQAPAAVHEAAHVVVPEVEADGVSHALRAAAAWRAELSS